MRALNCLLQMEQERSEEESSVGDVVRLSLLTMTNTNQLCDVLFVCFKMVDETNLSSKLPIADRTREV